jgi:hypothetical protein
MEVLAANRSNEGRSSFLRMFKFRTTRSKEANSVFGFDYCCNIAIPLIDGPSRAGRPRYLAYFTAAAFLGNISPMRLIWAPTARNFSSICS